MRPLRAVVLDVDGTLIDSNDAHARAWEDVLCERGFEVSFQEVRRLIGTGGDKLLPALTGLEVDSPRGAELVRRRGEVFRRRYLPTLHAFPSARALVERMREDGLVRVVASSASAEDLRALLEVGCLEDLIEARASKDDAARSKPDPDIVNAALRRAGCAAEEAVMLGDTPWDVGAAERAGLACVALRCGGWDDRALAGAAAIYQDPAELLRAYDQSPLARGALRST